jgi:hypothetical protein
MAQRVAELLAAARDAGLAIWAEGDHMVVRGPASAEPLASALHDASPAVLALLATTALRAMFPGPNGPPTAPCCECGSGNRLRLAERHVGWLLLDCKCGHRGYITCADYADWRLRQLRAATALTRLSQPFKPAVKTAAHRRSESGLAPHHPESAPARRPKYPMSDNETVAWKNLGNQFPTIRRFLRNPHELTNVDYGERTKTELESPFRPSGPLPQAARFTCGHGRTTLHAGTDPGRPLEPDELVRLVLVLHVSVFECDCLRPDWRGLFGEEFGQRSVVETMRLMRETRGPGTIGAVWERRLGPTARTWCVRPRSAA